MVTRGSVMRVDVGVVDEPSASRVCHQVADALRELRGSDIVGVWYEDGPREGTAYIMASCNDRERPVLQEAVRAAI